MHQWYMSQNFEHFSTYILGMNFAFYGIVSDNS